MKHSNITTINNYQVYQPIANKFLNHLEYMIAHRSRVFYLRLTIRYPQECIAPDSNQLIVPFLKALKQSLTHHYDCPSKYILYLWKIERLRSSNPHYHVTFLLPGSCCNNHYHILNEASRLWDGVLIKENLFPYNYDQSNYSSGLVNIDENIYGGPNVQMLDRNDINFKQIENEIKASGLYLSKIYSYYHIPNQRCFSGSDITH